MNQLSFTALGTIWNIESSSPIPDTIQIWLSQFEATYSRFIDSSFLNQISKYPGGYQLNLDGQRIIEIYLQLYPLTSGLFTPLIGQHLVESGYDSIYSLKPKTLTKLPKLNDIFNYQSPYITIKQSCQLDFGGVGKGYAIDKVAEILAATESDYFYINAGGDIYLQSKTPVEIALENPHNSTEAIGVAQISNRSICGSSSNRRHWSKFHHIINPNTMSSPSDIVASWVVADEAIIADSLATCLFLVPPQTLQSKFNFEYLTLDNDLTVTKSANFPAKLFL